MRRLPQEDRIEQGRTYEGRALHRPGDEIVDQGVAFDVATLLTRRRVLSLVGLGVGAVALAACSTASATDTATTSAANASGASNGSTSTSGANSEIPEETNGPYPADGTNGLNVLEDSGIVRSDITSSLDGGTTVSGVPLTFTFAVTDLAKNVPFEGAAVYVWHCDAQGRYSMYTQGVEGETFLRGVQVADAGGEVTFQTIVPGCYAGRWTHIHFEVYPDADSATDAGNAIATSQVAFPADMLGGVYALDEYPGSARNLAGVGTSPADDMVFGEGDWSLEMGTFTGDTGSGYVGSIAVGVDTTTAATGGGGRRPSR
jgi:protocatechuate 3,4-dioxygenase beta subunit